MKRILKHLLWIIPTLIVVAVVAGVGYTARALPSEAQDQAALQKSLRETSGDFQNGTEIPVQFSCKGAGISPQIQWTGAPENTKSYAMVTMDWDAPSPSLRMFPIVHWIVYNIPKDVTEIGQGWKTDDFNQRHISQGLNIAGAPAYAAPCPPLGQHAYTFHVYALDVDQIQPASNNKAGVMGAMQGHILAYGELVGMKSPG